MTITRPLAIAFTFVIALLAAEIHAAPAVIDACETTGGWTVAPADGVEASLETVATDDGAALRLHYHFVAGGGFVVLRRALDLDLGENYRFTFNVRGTGPPNNLEFKLIDTARRQRLVGQSASLRVAEPMDRAEPEGPTL